MRSWLAEQQVDAAEQHDLLLTVGEACSNAVEHAYHGTTPGEVEVEIARTEGGLVARVRDFGRWREESPDEDRGRGRGIIERLSDEMSVATGPGGTTVTIRLPLNGT